MPPMPMPVEPIGMPADIIGVPPMPPIVPPLYMFELAKYGFTAFLESFNPGSLYTGTLYVIVIMVTWVYYAAVIFILGGEVGQVYELRRVRRLQRETFED